MAATVHRGARMTRAGKKSRARTDGSQGAVASLRSTLAMPRSTFARLVGRTERAVIDWESGKSTPQGLSRQRVHELHRLVTALKGLVDPHALGSWFETPNPAFGGLKPLEVIERGESDRLWRMVFEMKSGAHI